MSRREISSPDLLLTAVLALAVAILGIQSSASTTAIVGVMVALLSYAVISVFLPAARVPVATRIAGGVIFGALIAFLVGSSSTAASFRESGWAMVGSVVFIAAIAAAAHLRRLSLPKRRRFTGGTISLPSIRPRHNVPSSQGGLTSAARRRSTSRTPAKIALFLLLVALASAFAFIYLHGSGVGSTSFYIDGEFSNLTSGRISSATVGVVNHERKPVAYTLVIDLDGSTLLKREIDLLDSQSWKETLSYMINSTGDGRKLAFLLYKDGILSYPYKEHNMTIKVNEPPVTEKPEAMAGEIQENATGANGTATQSVERAPAAGGGAPSTASSSAATSSTAGASGSSKQSTRTSRSSGGGSSSSSSGGASTTASKTSASSTTSTTSTTEAETTTTATKTENESAAVSTAPAARQSNVSAANESITSANKTAVQRSPTFSTGPAETNRPPAIVNMLSSPESPQPQGVVINWTVAASDPEADPISFRFLINGDIAADWSERSSWAWNTTGIDPGDYTVTAWIRDGLHAGTNSYDAKASKQFSIVQHNRPPQLVGLVAEPASPQLRGTQVTWTARASDPDGDPISYRFLINGQAGSGWSNEATWTWHTASIPEGLYNVSVWARDGRHAAADSFDSAVHSEFYLGTPNSPPEITEFAASPGSPAAAGTIVTLTAGATDPDGDIVIYRFLIDGRPLGNWSAMNSWRWDTSALAGGRYNISVQARDGKHAREDAADDETMFSYSLKQSNRTPELSGLSADPEGPEEPGARVTWTARASDPDGDPISYRFLLDDRPATDWSESPVWRWDTSGLDARRYNITVRVRDGKHATGDATDDETWASYMLSSPNKPPQVIDLAAEARGDHMPGSRVTWTATASDPEDDPISYRFLLDGTTSTDWSDSPTWRWDTTGLTPGDYNITVQVRDGKHADGNATVEAFDDSESASFALATANRPPQVSGLDADLDSPQEPGARINFTAHAIDPDDDPVSYRFFVNGNPATNWAPSSTWTWDTSGLSVGQYNVTVKARDSQYLEAERYGPESARLFDLVHPNRMPVLTGLSADPTGPQRPGVKITWTASASDPEGDPLSYLFLVDGYGTGNWSGSPTWIWNTTGLDAGDYNVTVRIRDGYHSGPEGYDAQLSMTSSLETTNIRPVVTSLSASPESPQDAGVIVTWTAAADDPDGDPISYLFLLNGLAVTRWSLSPSWSWDTTTLSEGDYRMEVRVRDGNHAGPDGFDSSKEAVFMVTSVIDQQIDQLMAARTSQNQAQFSSSDIQVAGGNNSGRAVLGRGSPSNASESRRTPVRVG